MESRLQCNLRGSGGDYSAIRKRPKRGPCRGWGLIGGERKEAQGPLAGFSGPLAGHLRATGGGDFGLGARIGAIWPVGWWLGGPRNRVEKPRFQKLDESQPNLLIKEKDNFTEVPLSGEIPVLVRLYKMIKKALFLFRNLRVSIFLSLGRFRKEME